MTRWEPGARERMVLAAVDLFTEQGYDATTVAQIAERAGVTKSTFFRHFPDKRELLVAGQEALSRLLAEGITEAPQAGSAADTVLALVKHSLADGGVTLLPEDVATGPARALRFRPCMGWVHTRV